MSYTKNNIINSVVLKEIEKVYNRYEEDYEEKKKHLEEILSNIENGSNLTTKTNEYITSNINTFNEGIENDKDKQIIGLSSNIIEKAYEYMNTDNSDNIIENLKTSNDKILKDYYVKINNEKLLNLKEKYELKKENIKENEEKIKEKIEKIPKELNLKWIYEMILYILITYVVSIIIYVGYMKKREVIINNIVILIIILIMINVISSVGYINEKFETPHENFYKELYRFMEISYKSIVNIPSNELIYKIKSGIERENEKYEKMRKEIELKEMKIREKNSLSNLDKREIIRIINIIIILTIIGLLYIYISEKVEIRYEYQMLILIICILMVYYSMNVNNVIRTLSKNYYI